MKYLAVPKRWLLLIAGAVWLFAGFNIMRLGTPDMVSEWTNPAICLLIAAGIFALFFGLIFYRMVQKHSRRIQGYSEERILFLRFFDRKSYLIMAFMITFGVLLRSSHLLPPLWIGVFYTGLGASLIGAGVLFCIKFAHWRTLS